jgi:hypothetical protein
VAVRILTLMLLTLGVIFILISLAFLGFAALGYFEILADVGPAENREMCIQLLWLGLPTLLCGMVLCTLAVVVFVRNQRRTVAVQH